MFGLPAETPVTTPLDEPAAANVVLLLLHVPPVVTSLNVTEEPAQTTVVPDIDAGNGFTVTF
jgi:hypothetical protein